MAKRKPVGGECVINPPDDLSESLFFGLHLDEEQRVYRDALWDKDTLVVFCDAKAGTGKTLIAVATGMIAVDMNRYNALTYLTAVGQERHQGFLPGTQQEKSEVYAQPLYDALITIGINPATVMSQNITNQKNGTAKVELLTPTYQRGVNLRKRFIIFDEAQNASFHDMKKMLTRVCDDSKLVVIGHRDQRDSLHTDSAFERYIDHFAGQDFCKVCQLTINHRGKVSTWADELLP